MLGRDRDDPRPRAWRATARSAAPRWHARTGDAAKVIGYLRDDDSLEHALERFAVARADQNDTDYAAFAEAADQQRITVERAV